MIPVAIGQAISSGIAGATGTAAKSKLGGLLAGGAGIGSSIAGLFGSKPKGFMPGPNWGKRQGKWAKQYYDQVAPGTSPHERLGKGTPSAGGESLIPSKTSQNVASQQVDTQKRIALANMALEKYKVDKQTTAQTIAAMGSYGTAGIKAALQVLKGQEPQEYDTNIKIDREKLPHEVRKLSREAQHLLIKATEDYHRLGEIPSDVKIKKIQAKYAEQFEKARIEKQMVPSYLQTIYRTVESKMAIDDKLFGTPRRMMIDGAKKVFGHASTWYRDRKRKENSHLRTGSW